MYGRACDDSCASRSANFLNEISGGASGQPMASLVARVGVGASFVPDDKQSHLQLHCGQPKSSTLFSAYKFPPIVPKCCIIVAMGVLLLLAKFSKLSV